MKQICLVALCVYFFMAFIGCKNSGPVTNPSTANPSIASGWAVPPRFDNTAEAVLNTKLSYYGKCVNEFSIQVHKSFLRYHAWCNKGCEKNGPSAEQSNMDMGVFALPDPTDCINGIKKANMLPPSLPALENSAVKFSQELILLYPFVQEAHQYYQQRSYQADQGAKGRELHPKLLSGWKNFEKVDYEVRGQFEAVQDDHAMQRVAEIEKTQGRALRFLTNNIMIKSKLVFRATLVEQWKENHQDLLAQRIEDYENAVAELERYLDFRQFPEHEKEAIRIGGFSFFPAASKNFLKSTQALMQQIENRKPLPRGNVVGSKENLLQRYNDLVDRANALDFGN